MANRKDDERQYPDDSDATGIETDSLDVDEMLYARHVEINSFEDLMLERGTPIPAMFNQFYKFIQNPSSVSVETFKRMIETDDTVGPGVEFLMMALAARIGRYEHKSKEITEWVNKRLDEISGGFHGLKMQTLTGVWAGFSTSEKCWANTENGFVVKKVLKLPPSTILFETDRTGNITDDGILQYQRNYNPGIMAQGIGFFGGTSSGGFGFTDGIRPDAFAKLGDLPFPLRTANSFNYLSIRIPRQKIIHFANNATGSFDNPYGKSILRRIYKYYPMKDAFLQMLAVALDRKGTPLTVVYSAQNTTLIDSEKANEGRGAGARGQPNKGIRADLAARQAFNRIHNDTVIFLPGMKGEIFDTDFIEQTANNEAFISSIEMCNKAIMRGLLLPSLVFTSGDGAGSFSLGQEHAKTFDKICDSMNSGPVDALLNQLVFEMIAYNFPRSAWEKDGIGSFSKRELSQDEIQKEMDVIDKAVNLGAIDMNDLNDLNKIRDKINFEPRETIIERPEEHIPGFDQETGGED